MSLALAALGLLLVGIDVTVVEAIYRWRSDLAEGAAFEIIITILLNISKDMMYET